VLRPELALPLIFVSGTLVAHPVHRRCPEVNHLPLTLANSQSKEPVSCIALKFKNCCPNVFSLVLRYAHLPPQCVISSKTITSTHPAWTLEHIFAEFPSMGTERIHVQRDPMSAILYCSRAVRYVAVEVICSISLSGFECFPYGSLGI